MAFCRYCGKEIPEGKNCDCTESKAAQQTQATQQTQSVHQANIVSDCVDDFLGLLINPIECIEKNLAKPNQITGYIFLVINLLILFIGSSFSIFHNSYIEKNQFLCGIELAASIGIIKLFMAFVSYVTKDVDTTFDRAFGTFCYTTIPTTVLMIVMVLVLIFQVPFAHSIIRLSWASLDMLYGYFAFKAMHKNSQSNGIGIYVIAQVLACVIFSVLYYYI